MLLHNGEVKSLAWPPSDAMPPLAEAPRGALPGSRMQTAGPLTVFLSEPRTDYRHGALGDGVEAGRVTISERQPLGGHQTSARPVPVKTGTSRGSVFGQPAGEIERIRFEDEGNQEPIVDFGDRPANSLSVATIGLLRQIARHMIPHA